LTLGAHDLRLGLEVLNLFYALTALFTTIYIQRHSSLPLGMKISPSLLYREGGNGLQKRRPASLAFVF
jgi:hypothetical protein